MLAADRLVRTFDTRVAVADLSFEVRAGEIFGLLGPNGAGKTTTLRMLGGLIRPTEGTVRVDGVAMDRASAARLRGRIGFLTETPGLWDQLTVADNLLVYARLFGMRGAAPAVERSLRQFELWDRRGDRAALLSKGMKQKLALARALLHDPPNILLDEPTANLDPETARMVRDLLHDLRQRGRAIVVSTHNLDEVERVADRIALVRTSLVAEGPPSELRRRVFGHRLRIRLATTPPASMLATVAASAGGRDVQVQGASLIMAIDDPAAATPAIVRALVDAGAAILEARDETPPLEDVYLRLLDTSR